MRSASAALLALINAGNQEWVKADLYTFFDAAGAVLGRYTNHDQDVTAGGNTFSADGPVFKRSAVKTVIGMEVDTLQITIGADSSKLLGGVPWLQALRNGALDGGRVLLERFLSDSWTNTTVGTVIWFGGRVGPVGPIGRSSAVITVKSDLALLNVMMPREIYQPECLNTLFDTKCALVKANFAVAGTVGGGSTVSLIPSALPEADGYFDLGTIAFTSGVNAGITRSVKRFASGAFTLLTPLLQACTTGDAFTATPGCDKLQATCGINSAVVFTRSVNKLVATAHGFSNDEAVFLASTGALPAPLSAVQRYFVNNASANDFEVSTTIRGTSVTLTDNGTGTHTVVQHGKFANLPNYRGTPYVPVPETAL